MNTVKKTVPIDVLGKLLTGFVAREAELIQDARRPGAPLTVGNEAGKVFAWLWATNPEMAIDQLDDLLTQLNQRLPQGVTLSELLAGFEFAWYEDAPALDAFRRQAEKDLMGK